MYRIAIIGNAGSGKSTFAMKLHEITKLPVYHVDKILWKENWERTPEKEFCAKHLEIISSDKWILDGVGNETTWNDRFEASDTIIFLDLPLRTCQNQAVKRMEEDLIRPNPFVPKGCPYPIEYKTQQVQIIEKFHNELVPKLKEYSKKFEENKQVIYLKNKNEIDKFLKSIK